MNLSAETLDSNETRVALSTALHRLHGDSAELGEWATDDHFTNYGKRKVVRYDLEAHVAGELRLRRYQWLGKFYDRDEDARRVATVLRELASGDYTRRGGFAVPRVLAYHPPRRLLLMTYESGESVGSAIARDTAAVLTATARALAALHGVPITPARITSPATLLDDLQRRVEELCARFPGDAASLGSGFTRLQQDAPDLPAVPCFVHGDFGPANLLWRMGGIVVLDFDKCARGDPALDLGNLLTQLRRITVRKPDRLRDFASARATVLEAYQRWRPPDPGLDRRVAWYERAILLRKIHRLVFREIGNQGAEVMRHRLDEANQLLGLMFRRRIQPTRARSLATRQSRDAGTVSALAPERPRLAAAGPDGFPTDPEFPQLAVATNPRLMLDLFRAHLKPVAGKVFHVEDCTPVRFRCRQSTDRCVLQYSLRVIEPATGRRWDQWVTGMLFAEDGKAERRWRKMQAWDPAREIPESWLTFEPVSFIPDLRMLVQVFPFDRRLRNLSRVMGGGLRDLEPQLLARLGPGEWHVEERTIEPTRYRTELGAALKYTICAREPSSAERETIRCYVKVYREEQDAEALQLLRSLSERGLDRKKPYSVIKPIAYLGDMRTLAVEEAPGHSLTQLLLQGGDPAEIMRRAARAVAAFNQDDLPITRRGSLADQLEDVKMASTMVQWACPHLRPTVQAITDAVVEGLDEVAPGPVHGDMKPDHIFVSGDRVTFIDLDLATLGDPVRDPAHLFSYLAGRVGLDSVSPNQARAASTAFVEEYFRCVPGSWRMRFPLHCAGALVEVASGIFRHQGSGWRERITEVLDVAQQAISGRIG